MPEREFHGGTIGWQLALASSQLLIIASPRMKFLFPALLLTFLSGRASAQQIGGRTPGKAAILSLVVPGLGHRYVHEGQWYGSAAYYVLADASFWLSLAGVEWYAQQTVESYGTLANSRAGVSLADKDRRFLINLGLYRSSEEYREDHLRRHLWDRINYVDAPGFQWEWQSEEDLMRYRGLREEADTWDRRRILLISALATNRILAAVTSLLAARRNGPALLLAVAPPPAQARWPVVRLAVGL